MAAMEDAGISMEDEGPQIGFGRYKETVDPLERSNLELLEHAISGRARAWAACDISNDVLALIAAYVPSIRNPPEEFVDTVYAPVIRTCITRLNLSASEQQSLLATALRVHVTHTVQSASDQQVLLSTVARAVLSDGSIADACQMLPGATLPAQRMGLPFESHAWPKVDIAAALADSYGSSVDSQGTAAAMAGGSHGDRQAASGAGGITRRESEDEEEEEEEDDSGYDMEISAAMGGMDLGVGSPAGSEHEVLVRPAEVAVSLYDRYLNHSSISFCPLVPVRIHSAHGHARLLKQRKHSAPATSATNEVESDSDEEGTAVEFRQHPSSRLRPAQYVRPEHGDEDSTVAPSHGSSSRSNVEMQGSGLRVPRRSGESAVGTSGRLAGRLDRSEQRSRSSSTSLSADSESDIEQPEQQQRQLDSHTRDGPVSDLPGGVASSSASARSVGTQLSGSAEAGLGSTSSMGGQLRRSSGPAGVGGRHVGIGYAERTGQGDPETDSAEGSSQRGAAFNAALPPDPVGAGSVDAIVRGSHESGGVGLVVPQHWMDSDVHHYPALTQADPTAVTDGGNMLDPYIPFKGLQFDLDAFVGVLMLAHPDIAPQWEGAAQGIGRNHPILCSGDYFLSSHFASALGVDKPGWEMHREWLVDGLMGVHNSSSVQPKYHSLPSSPDRYLVLLAPGKQRSPAGGSIRASWSTSIAQGLLADIDYQDALQFSLPNEDDYSPEEYAKISEEVSMQAQQLLRSQSVGIGCCLSVFAAGDHSSVVKYAVATSKAASAGYDHHCREAQRFGWPSYRPTHRPGTLAFEEARSLASSSTCSIDEAIEIGRKLLPQLKAIPRLEEGSHLQLFGIGSTTFSVLLPPGLQDVCKPLLCRLADIGPSMEDSGRLRERKCVDMNAARGFWVSGTYEDRLRSCLLFIVQQGLVLAQEILRWDGPELVQHIVLRSKPTATSQYSITLVPRDHVSDSVFRPVDSSLTQSPSSFLSAAMRIMRSFGQPGHPIRFSDPAMSAIPASSVMLQVLLVREVARCAIVYFQRVGCKAVAAMEMLTSLVRHQLDQTRENMKSKQAHAEAEANAVLRAQGRRELYLTRGGNYRDTADGRTLGLDRDIDNDSVEEAAGAAGGGGAAGEGGVLNDRSSQPEASRELGPPGPQSNGLRDIGACCLALESPREGQPRQFVYTTDGPSSCYTTMAIGTSVCGCVAGDDKYVAVPVPRSIQLAHSRRKQLLSSMLYNTALQAGKYSIQSERGSPYGGIQCIGEYMASLSGTLPKAVDYEDVALMMDSLMDWDMKGIENDQIQSFLPVCCMLGAEFHVYSPGFRAGQPTPGHHGSGYTTIQKGIVAPYGHRSSSAVGNVADTKALADRTACIRQDVADILESSEMQHVRRFDAMFSTHSAVRIEVDVPATNMPLFVPLVVVHTEDVIRKAKLGDGGQEAFFARGIVQLVDDQLLSKARDLRLKECERVTRRAGMLFSVAICDRMRHPRERAAMFSLAVSILRTHHEGCLAVRTDSWSQVIARQILATGIAATHPLRQLPVLDRIDIGSLSEALRSQQSLLQIDVCTTARLLVGIVLDVLPPSSARLPRMVGGSDGKQLDASPIPAWGLLAICEIIIASINLCGIAECSGGTWRLGVDPSTRIPTITAYTSEIDGVTKKVVGFPGGLSGIRTALRADAIASMVAGIGEEGKAGLRLVCRTHIHAAAELEEYLYHAYMIQCHATKPHYDSGQKRGMLVRSSMAVCLYGELVSRGLLPRHIVLQGIAAVLRRVQIVILPYVSGMMRGTHNAGQFQMKGAATMKPLPGPCRLICVTRKYSYPDGVTAALPGAPTPRSLMLEHLRAAPMLRASLGEASMQEMNFMTMCSQWVLPAAIVGSARPDWSRAEPGTRGPASASRRGASKAAAHSGQTIEVPLWDFAAKSPQEIAASIACKAARVLMMSVRLQQTGHWVSNNDRWGQPWLGSVLVVEHKAYPERRHSPCVATPGWGSNIMLPAVVHAAPALLVDGEKYQKAWSSSSAYSGLRREMQGTVVVRRHMDALSEALSAEGDTKEQVTLCRRAVEVSSEAMATSLEAKWAAGAPPVLAIINTALQIDASLVMKLSHTGEVRHSADRSAAQASMSDSGQHVSADLESSFGIGEKRQVGISGSGTVDEKDARGHVPWHKRPRVDESGRSLFAADRLQEAREKYIPILDWKPGQYFKTLGVEQPRSHLKVACRAHCLAILTRTIPELEEYLNPRCPFGSEGLQLLKLAVADCSQRLEAENLSASAFPDLLKSDDSPTTVLKWKKLCKAAWKWLIDNCPGALPRYCPQDPDSGFQPQDYQLEEHSDVPVWTPKVAAKFLRKKDRGNSNGQKGDGSASHLRPRPLAGQATPTGLESTSVRLITGATSSVDWMNEGIWMNGKPWVPPEARISLDIPQPRSGAGGDTQSDAGSSVDEDEDQRCNKPRLGVDIDLLVEQQAVGLTTRVSVFDHGLRPVMTNPVRITGDSAAESSSSSSVIPQPAAGHLQDGKDIVEGNTGFPPGWIHVAGSEIFKWSVERNWVMVAALSSSKLREVQEAMTIAGDGSRHRVGDSGGDVQVDTAED